MTSFYITLPLKRCSLSALLVLLCCFSFSHAHGQRKAITNRFVDFHVSSLLPQEEPSCTPSSRGKKEGVVSLEVVHRHGPCSKLRSASTKHGSPSHSDLLLLDQDRVDSIHARLSSQSVAGDKVQLDSSSANLPDRSGASIGSANYIVSVGLGTPQKQLSLIFDTGSDITWTQCQPCLKSCYSQVDPIFDPTSSSSYTNITCDSPVCTDLVAATGIKPGCSSSTCVYGTQYGDNSFTVGFFAKERLTLTSSDYIDGFFFGCGENNQGLFRGSAGLIGLGRNQLSLVSQAAGMYGKYFSYCLPQGSNSTGHLTLGQGGSKATSFSYTPLVTGSHGGDLYSVNLQSISVGGRQLSITPAVFSAAGTIVDSGTVISRLPPQAYAALRTAFRQYMSKYPSAQAFSILDTCYDLSKYQTVSVPKVTLYFGGGGVLDLPVTGILAVGSGISQVCLAFAGNSGNTDVGIVGNVQQKGFDVVYDVDGGRIGFGSNGC